MLLQLCIPGSRFLHLLNILNISACSLDYTFGSFNLGKYSFEAKTIRELVSLRV